MCVILFTLCLLCVSLVYALPVNFPRTDDSGCKMAVLQQDSNTTILLRVQYDSKTSLQQKIKALRNNKQSVNNNTNEYPDEIWSFLLSMK